MVTAFSEGDISSAADTHTVAGLQAGSRDAFSLLKNFIATVLKGRLLSVSSQAATCCIDILFLE